MLQQTLKKKSRLDSRLRIPVFSGRDILDVHLLAIPLFERHTGKVIADTTIKALGALTFCPQKLLACTMDGTIANTGVRNGAVSLIEDFAMPGVIRVWCVPHQLNVMLQKLYLSMSRGSIRFIKTLD